jgi:hypothetical protein
MSLTDPEYDADVQHLAEYTLSEPPYRAPTTDHHDRRVHSLALAIQRTIEAWLDSHPLAGKERQRWSRAQPRNGDEGSRR